MRLHDTGTAKLLADIAATPPMPVTAIGPDAVTPRMEALHWARRIAADVDSVHSACLRTTKVSDRTCRCLLNLRNGYTRLGDALEANLPAAEVAAIAATLHGLTLAVDDTDRCPCCGEKMTDVADDSDTDGRAEFHVGMRCDGCDYDETECFTGWKIKAAKSEL